jgi:RHS repeat-associated protein
MNMTWKILLIFGAMVFAEQAHAVLYLARPYEPNMARWISRDPIGERGGINLYQFVGNSPIDRIDPLGLLVTGTYNEVTGVLTVMDLDTHETMSINAESGGKPFGDPIPVGNYDILEQGRRPDFFRLEPLDEHYGNDKDDATGRGLFRLHRPGRTWGCIAAKDKAEWDKLRDMIRRTSTTTATVDSKSWNPWAPKTESLTKYGDLHVINPRPLIFPPIDSQSHENRIW